MSVKTIIQFTNTKGPETKVAVVKTRLELWTARYCTNVNHGGGGGDGLCDSNTTLDNSTIHRLV